MRLRSERSQSGNRKGLKSFVHPLTEEGLDRAAIKHQWAEEWNQVLEMYQCTASLPIPFPPHLDSAFGELHK